MLSLPAVAVLLLLLLCLALPASAGEHEYRLTKYLMSNYEPSVRPASVATEALMVEYDVSLHQIIDVDEKNQILTTNCWITAKWIDSHLTWNASDFGDISTIRLPYDRVWLPDIILYNNADSNYNNAIINTNVIVNYTGEVSWLSHGIFKSSCKISVEYFPFDIQNCKLKWASWTYDGLSLDLSIIHQTGDETNYQPNGEFELEGFRPERHVVYYSCCKEPYIDITYYIRLRRRPMFYVFNLILPCILINGIALLVFYVPSESGEKVTLGISALLSMTVFLMTIRESLPPTEKTPLISLYYGVSICLVSFASAMAVVTLNIHHRGVRGNEVPEVVKQFVLGFLSRFVFLHFDASNNGGGAGGAGGVRRINPFTHNAREENSKDPSGIYEENSDQNYSDQMMTVLEPQNCAHHPHFSFMDAVGQHFPSHPNYADNNGAVVQGNNHSGSVAAAAAQQQPQQPQQQKLVYRSASISQQRSVDSDGGGMPAAGGFARRGGGPTASTPGSTSSNGGGSNSGTRMFSARNPLLGNLPHVNSVDETFYDPRLNQILGKFSNTIDKNELRNAESDAREKSALEWKQVSLVLDRLLLLVFFLAITISSLVILTSSPYLYNGHEVPKGDTRVTKPDSTQ